MELDLSVIIPFKDKAEMTLECVDSFIKFGPAVTEILLISNKSSPLELAKIQTGIATLSNVKLLQYDEPFNYQKLNNWAVSRTVGAFVLFLNNDTELVPKSSGLLEYMYELAGSSEVGAVGCMLLYGDGATIQHGGVYLMSGGLAEHLYVGRKLAKVEAACVGGELSPNVCDDVRMTAVTGAVTLVERRKFELINGFDERFIICGGDVDLCLRLDQAGFSTIFAGSKNGYILHKESQSRSHKPVPFNDFYYSYLSYIKGYDLAKADRYIPNTWLNK